MDDSILSVSIPASATPALPRGLSLAANRCALWLVLPLCASSGTLTVALTEQTDRKSGDSVTAMLMSVIDHVLLSQLFGCCGTCMTPLSSSAFSTKF